MSKSTVDRLFIGAIIAVIAGWVVAIVAIIAALAGGAVVFGGPNVVTVNGGPFASALGVLTIGSLLILGGTIAGVASWVGALVNTARLDDKTWFFVLLVLGIWSFGFVAMIFYVIAGPATPELAEAPASSEAPVIAQWRRATWALVIWNVLMILWLASTLQGEFSCVGETGAARAVCDAGASIGLSLGASLVGVIWFIGLVTIGLIWLMSRPRTAAP